MRLTDELVALDLREARKPGHNRYALGIMLQAAESVEEEVKSGVSLTDAFADHFVPTRGMHKVARNLGLDLDVERGQWVRRTK